METKKQHRLTYYFNKKIPPPSDNFEHKHKIKLYCGFITIVSCNREFMDIEMGPGDEVTIAPNTKYQFKLPDRKKDGNRNGKIEITFDINDEIEKYMDNLLFMTEVSEKTDYEFIF